MKIVMRIIVMLIAAALAAFDAAVFYFVADHVFGWTATWPMLAIVFWVQETVFGLHLREEMKKEGLL